jgi:hypothetical protein
MSGYYKAQRNPDWNYGGGRWKLSRSKIDLFKECPRCFYLDNKLGTARPPGYPFSLNSAVDHLLKKEFDLHRVGKTAHPLMTEYGINAVPFEHADMNIWRENFKGVQAYHEPTDLRISGAVDDVWVNLDTKELHVVDYKATSKDEDPNLDAEWQDGYKRQMEVYQWLLRQNGHKVSDVGYFVYANGLKDKKAFDKKLEFDVLVIPYEGKDDWVGPCLHDIKKTLDSNDIPQAGNECDYCIYRETAGKTFKKHMESVSGNTKKATSEVKDKLTSKNSSEQNTLF